MPTSAIGHTTSGRANHAKKPSANRDHQTQDANQQSDEQEGPPYKKRRTNNNAHDSVVDDAAGTRTNGKKSDKKLKKKSLELNHLENLGPRPLLEPPEGKKPQNDSRVLRSQDGTGHGTSDLAAYFDEYYRDVFGGEATTPFVDYDSSICLIEEASTTDPASLSRSSLPLRSKSTIHSLSPRKSSKISTQAFSSPYPSLAPPTQSSARQIIDLSKYDDEARSLECDPLEDEYYKRSHAKGERLEKHAKNQEKEKTAHEKPQLENLLDELQGSDWWRTMGIQNLSDVERRKFAPKRDLYITKVRELLSKFEAYKEKEERLAQKRRRKLEGQPADDEGGRRSQKSKGKLRSRRSSSDLDPSAQQLHAEAGLKVSVTKKITLRMPEKVNPEVIATKPFVSFFAKPHERAGALSSHRRGRHILAFGLPLPVMPEESTFELPEQLLRHRNQQHRKSSRRKGAAATDGEGTEESVV